MALSDKALKYFNLNGATAARLAAHNPDWAPVITGIDASLSAAADLNILIGGSRATLAVNPTGNNNTFTVTALRKGNCGENITIEVVENGNDTPLSIGTTVTSHAITSVAIVVNVETDGSGNGISVPSEVCAALNADDVASKYVYATYAATDIEVIAADVAQAPLASSTPTEVVEYTYPAAGQLNIDAVDGLFIGTGGDDIEVTVTAGTLDANIRGFWIQGVEPSILPVTILASGRARGASGT
jgi:hypothetical protein